MTRTFKPTWGTRHNYIPEHKSRLKTLKSKLLAIPLVVRIIHKILYDDDEVDKKTAKIQNCFEISQKQ